MLYDRNLATANTVSELIATMPRSAKQALEADVMKSGIESYTDLIGKIKEHKSQETTVKFFCPLTVQLYEYNEYGEIDEYSSSELDGRFAAQYEDEIKAAIAKYSERDERNMAEYFDGSNGATAKLKSMQWGVESYGRELYGVVTVKLSEPLTDDEKAEVVDFVCGQNSDGWGEGFEQREMNIDEGQMFVSFWNSSDDYFIKDDDEFGEYLSQHNGIGFGGME